jgi:tetrahydromethanopterin S-methyltransferase subunit G
MNLCDSGHDEVCYESRHCPACSIASEKDDEIASLNERIDDLKKHVEELESEEA